MPRNHRSSSRTPSRPVQTAPPKRESHSAVAAPPVSQPVHVQQAPGFLQQVAATAAGAAAGHMIGRTIGNLFEGNSSSAPAEVTQSHSATNDVKNVAPQCQEYSKLFMQCMDRNGNEFSFCQDYMEMMKACQQQYA